MESRGQERRVTLIRALAFANGVWEFEPYPHCVELDFDSVKQWMIFQPKEFLDKVLEVTEKQKCLIWDDAGYWLFSLDWYEPFVKAVSRWIQIAGTQFACIILTTPETSLISSKVLAALPNHHICHVTKAASDTYMVRDRLAKSYQKWRYPDGRQGGVRKRWTDKFNAMLPDDFFNWYNPIRKGYLGLAKDMMAKRVMELESKGTQKEKSAHMETVHKATGGIDKINEVMESINSRLTP